MSYVDGFVLPIKKENVGAYTEIAGKMSKIWVEHGALEYKECVLEDSTECEWCITFNQLAQPKEEETIVFAYIVYKDRAHRDAVNAKVMEDPRVKDACDPENSPFDCKRMAYSGFKSIVEAKLN